MDTNLENPIAEIFYKIFQDSHGANKIYEFINNAPMGFGPWRIHDSVEYHLKLVTWFNKELEENK